MKRTTKLLASAVAAVALFFTTNANAQGPKLGIGINAGVPTTDQYNFTLGADARLQFDVSKQLSIPVTAGYTHFFSKDAIDAGTLEKQNYSYIPVKAGVKVFFDESGSGLYGLAEIGAAFGVSDHAKTGFLYSPAIGYAWSSGLDLGVKYEGISSAREQTFGYDKNVGHVALRLAYGFKL
ncbi:outer membrane beta-barrel protein [Pedobacter sp.]|uniref:outer membrane beta-barrel protein n=1 Tax=Pedobacter sp. TaxID=1411316 RepID=UPI003D7F480A